MDPLKCSVEAYKMSSTEEVAEIDNISNDSNTSSPSVDQNKTFIPKDMQGMFGVHVSNLPPDLTERDLTKTFSEAGYVRVCKVVDSRQFRDSRPGSSPRIYAFVKFLTSEEAQAALFKFNGFSIDGYTLAVRPAYDRLSGKKGSGMPYKKHGKGWFSSSESRIYENDSEKDASEETKARSIGHNMGSTDYRLREGKLLNGEVMTFNFSSAQHSVPKGGRNQVLAPRFQRRSQPVTLSRDTHPATKKSLTSTFQLPSPGITQMNDIMHEQSVVSGAPVMSVHNQGDVYNTHGRSSSALKPFQPAYNHEPRSWSNGPLGEAVTTVASALSQLGFSPPTLSAAEAKEGATRGAQMQPKDLFTQRQTGGQKTASWSQTTVGVAPLSNNSDISLQSPLGDKGSPNFSPTWVTGISSWSRDDVAEFFQATDCAEYASFFQEQEIDGKALMLLNRDTLLQFMKVGPALKVLQLIDKLRSTIPVQVNEHMLNTNGW